MIVLITSVKPEHTDVSTMEGLDFLVKGVDVQFTILSNKTAAERLTLTGHYFHPGEPTLKKIEERVMTMIHQVANDDN